MMGDFDGKVGDNKENDTVLRFGVGMRNDNREREVKFLQEI